MGTIIKDKMVHFVIAFFIFVNEIHLNIYEMHTYLHISQLHPEDEV